jgi:hypothetical protein
MPERIAVLRIGAALLAAALCARAAGAAPLLSLDFNARSSLDAVDTQSGFVPFTLSDNGSTVAGGVQVTLSAVGANTTLGDRDRTAPANVGAFTLSEVYDDFIFAQTSGGLYTVLTGMDITLTGLAPSTPYAVSLYAYDSNSSGTRTADWSGNGESMFTTSFEGKFGVSPATDATHRYDATASTDAAGTLTLSGRWAGGSPGVFADGLTVSLAPEPTSAVIFGFTAMLLLRRKRAA